MIQKVKLTSMDLLAQLMQPVLDEGKSVKFTVVGNSMHPIFRNGLETVVVEKLEKVSKYDVIFYRRECGEYVLHRIVGRGKDGWRLCGDHQVYVEYPVKDENIIAVMTGFCRNGKYITTDKLWYRVYSFIWTNLIFMRPLMYKTALYFRKIIKKR